MSDRACHQMDALIRTLAATYQRIVDHATPNGREEYLVGEPMPSSLFEARSLIREHQLSCGHCRRKLEGLHPPQAARRVSAA